MTTHRYEPHLADRADIIRWADRMEARSEFPRLIRNLIRRNNDQVAELEMRAAEGTGASGYDGVTRAARATPFVPEGLAVWELGVGANFKKKANDDYNKRSGDPLGHDPGETTFVFVTPRHWEDKQTWARAKKKEGTWADVRALDVDDLEDALEQAPAVHARFSEMVGKPSHGAQTVEDWWESFRALSVPTLDPEMALAGRANDAAELLRVLEAESRTTSIAAASVDDVLAFVAAAILSTTPDPREDLLARALIVRDAYTLRSLATADGLLILIPFEDELRREARLIRTHHVVIRAEDGGGCDIGLPPIDQATFRQILIDRGEAADRAEELAKAARHSLIAYQRKAAFQGTGLAPEWAAKLDSRVTRRGWLAGRWNERRTGDLDALGALFEQGYDESREELVQLTGGPDPLFVVVGDTWAVASMDDAWQHGHQVLQRHDLEAYEALVQTVLGAVDPRLELPVRDRWLAGVYGKVRLHSSDLRQGIADVLALLGARGQAVTLGSATVESWLRNVLWQLLNRCNEDDSGQLWASLTDVMPLLAEAVPDVFLDAVQRGLEGDQPLLGMMFADGEGDVLTVSSPHTGLLWALESVAWSTEHFSLAVEQVARLEETDPGGRLSNRPAKTLASIFRPWLPQTAADLETRLATLDGIRARHPDVAWTLVLSMLPEHHATGTYTASPKYRNWKPPNSDKGAPDATQCFESAALRAIEDANSDPDRWAEVVSRFDDLPPEARQRAIDRLEETAQSSPAVGAKAWDPLHALVQRHRRYSHTNWAMSAATIELLRSLLEKLAPADSVSRVRWLFDHHMPDLPQEGGEEFESGRYREAVRFHRREALEDLIESGGSEAVLDLAREAKYPFFVGTAVADADADEIGLTLLDYIDQEDTQLVSAATGWTTRKGSEDWAWIDEMVRRFRGRPLAVARLLLVSHDLTSAWSVAEQDESVDAAYWNEFSPYGRGRNFAPATEACRRLLAHDRPRTALALINLYGVSNEIDRELVVEALEHLLEIPEDRPDQTYIDGHEIGELLDYVRGGQVDEERLAVLEWRLRPALGFDAHSPILERKLATESPFFVEVLSMAFKPRSREPEQEVPSDVASNAFRLLDDWRVVPGSDGPGMPIDEAVLNAWVDDTLVLLQEAGRLEIGLDQIGKVLAKATGDDDGSWPAQPVRNVVERISRSELDGGFRAQVYNSRGVTSRGLMEGGDQERELSAHYSRLAEGIRPGWPRTSAILQSVADGYAAEARLHDEQVQRFREGLGR